MTKVERLLINKGHYLDDAYAMCEEMFTAVEQCKADMVEAIEDIVERMEVKDAKA